MQSAHATALDARETLTVSPGIPPDDARDAGTRSAVVQLGEIHTGLLQNSSALTTEAAAELLALIPQESVRTWERPVRHAASPETLTGVDCELPAASGTRVRAIGTVAAEARVTGGHLLQSSARAQVAPAAQRRRLPWSHYLTRPAVLEALGDIRRDDVIDGFLRPGASTRVLDLGGVCTQLMGSVQAAPIMDRKPPFRAARTRLRWVATVTAGQERPSISFTVEDAALRTVRLSVPAELADRVPELCQDLALHDWLLSCVGALIDVAHIGRRRRADVLHHLSPAVDHLLHIWMPAARLAEDLRGYWSEIEKRSGFTRQWDAADRRVRDQVALATVDLVSAQLDGSRTGTSPP